jgi:hypothetical protein
MNKGQRFVPPATHEVTIDENGRIVAVLLLPSLFIVHWDEDFMSKHHLPRLSYEVVNLMGYGVRHEHMAEDPPRYTPFVDMRSKDASEWKIIGSIY